MKKLNWFILAFVFSSIAVATSYPVLNGQWTAGTFLAGPASPSPAGAMLRRAVVAGDLPSTVPLSSGTERIERAKLNCDASSAVTSQSGSWISSIGNRATQGCSVTLTSGIFSAAPTCNWSRDGSVEDGYPLIVVSSSTALVVYARKYDNTAYLDHDGYLICMGPR